MRTTRGSRIKSALRKERRQRIRKTPYALVTATTLFSATGVLTATPVQAAATANVSAGKSAKITDYLNCRTGPDENYHVLGVIHPGDTVTFLERIGGWAKVRTQHGTIGWVKAQWVQVLTSEPAPQPAPVPPASGGSGSGQQGTVTDDVNFRTGASLSSEVMSVLSPGTPITLLSRSGQWVQAKLSDGRVGWVFSEYVNASSSGNNGGQGSTSTGGQGSTSGGGSSSGGGNSSVYRITQYPSAPNFYEARGSLLFHVFGTPDARTASYQVGTAPAFMHEGAIYVRDQNHQFYRRDTNADVSVGSYVPAFETLDLRLVAPVTAADLNNFISQNRPDGLLAGSGQLFISAQNKYGVSAQYLMAHAILESGWGTSQICRDKNNFFGYQAYDNSPYASAAYFQSLQDSIEYEAYFVRNSFLNSTGQWYGGEPNLDGMNVHYASDQLWSEKIAGIMSMIRAYSSSDYRGKLPAPVLAGAPTGPLKSIVTQTVPTGTTGVATQTVSVYVTPSSNVTAIAHLHAGDKVTVQGMQTDRWYQVKVGNQTGFVSVDSLHLTNILQVQVSDALNVRSLPSTSGSIMGIVKNGAYLQANLDSNGQPIVKNGWNQITYNGSICYVYGQFVQAKQTL